MSLSLPSDEQLRNDAQVRTFINRELEARFAPEDDALRGATASAQAENLRPLLISPLKGKLLQVLAMACGARTILEIGTMIGYSGVWLARGLPPNGKLISLEVNPKNAEIARATFAAAGLSDRAEVRVGAGRDLLPTLVPEAPFDLTFIDADKENYQHYLEWAITLSRTGSLIVADNTVLGGHVFEVPPTLAEAVEGSTFNRMLLDAGITGPAGQLFVAGPAAYNRKILEHPRLVSVALPNEEDGLDGFAISVVRN